MHMYLISIFNALGTFQWCLLVESARRDVENMK